MSRDRIIKAAFWLTLSEVIFTVSGYIVHSGVGRILGPAEYGRYGLVITLTTMIIILVGRGIPTAMAKYLSEIYETKPGMIAVIKRQTIIAQGILMGSITVLFFLLAPVISTLLGDPTLTPLFQISSLIIPSFAAAAFYMHYYTGLHRFNIQSILKTVRSLARVGIIIGLAFMFQVKGAVVGYVGVPLLVFLVAWTIDKAYMRREIEKTKESTAETKESQEKFSWKKLIAFAWPVTLFMIFYEILITIDLYFVKGLLHNDFLTGIYNGSLTLARVPYYLFYALTIILFPTISKTTSQNDVAETKKVINQSMRIMVMLLFPAILLMFAYAKPIISIFYGSEYLLSTVPMQILVFGVGFLTVFYVMSFAMNGAGKVKIPMYIALGGAVLNVVLSYFLIIKFEILGAAIATTISSAIVMLVMIYFVKKYFQTLMSFSRFSKMAVAALLMYFLSTFLPGGTFIFIVWSALLLVIYFLLLYIFKEIKQEDIQLFKDLLSRKKKTP